jgi:phosphate transport system substrate-binding protein
MIRNNKKWLVIPFVIALSAALIVTGCGTKSGTVNEAGSTTVQPVLEAIAGKYMEEYPDVNIVVQGGGSSTGVKSVSDGTVDTGAASRELKDSEKGLGLVEHVLAQDGIAIVTHPSQSVSGLTTDQVKAILSGEITSWSQVGGADKEIHVNAREEGSGTRDAFEELVMGDALITEEAIQLPSNAALRTAVSNEPDAIGFLSMGYVTSDVKALSINGIAATVDNAKNGSYPVVRPLLLLTLGEPEGIVKDFIDYCLSSEGQDVVEEEGYIRID